MAHHTRGRKSPTEAISAPVPADLEPPEGFPQSALDEWSRVMPILGERGVLSEADLAAVEFYCLAVSDAQEARTAITKDGAYFNNARGELKRHPAFATLREANGEARRWAAELGLTPASRGRIAQGETDDDTASDLGL